MVFAKTEKAASYLSRFLRNDGMDAAGSELSNGDGGDENGVQGKARVHHRHHHQNKKKRGVIFVGNLTEKARSKSAQLEVPSTLDFNREYICVVNGPVQTDSGRLIDYIRIKTANKV